MSLKYRLVPFTERTLHDEISVLIVDRTNMTRGTTPTWSTQSEVLLPGPINPRRVRGTLGTLDTPTIINISVQIYVEGLLTHQLHFQGPLGTDLSGGLRQYVWYRMSHWSHINRHASSVARPHPSQDAHLGHLQPCLSLEAGTFVLRQ